MVSPRPPRSGAKSPATWPTAAAVFFSTVNHPVIDTYVSCSTLSLNSHVYHLDLYSRGYSVGPPVDHDPLLYVSQLDDLLRHVGWKKANFVGLSLVKCTHGNL